MGFCVRSVPAGYKTCGVAVSLLLMLGAVAGCGPSEDEISADIEEVCRGLIEDLSGLEAEPAFGALAGPADEARHEFGAAAYRVEDVSTEGAAVELATALDDARDAYDDLEKQLVRREYGSLAETRAAGEAALADALAAAESMGATECAGIDVRAGYFAIAADGADAAAAAIAPTGDYVTDADAACARFTADTYLVFLRLGLQSLIGGDDGSGVTARDYLDALEDQFTLGTALDVLVGELEVLAPPSSAEAGHARLIEGYRIARAGVGSLADEGGVEMVADGAEQVNGAAKELGLDCSL